MEDFEKLGAFYLGREYDLKENRTKEELLLYDSKDLTTHAVCVGMTGSGKTGLCISLLEEAAIDGIPALVIDPKGDLGNMMLTFPGLEASDFRPWIDEEEAARKGLTTGEYANKTASLWRKGLETWGQDAARIAKFRQSADIAIFTPGSNTGLPLTVLRSFNAPDKALVEDTDALRDRIMAAVSGLLALLGMDTDPIKSREHILLSSILQNAWRSGRDLSIADLIREVQTPPFDRIGVFDLDSFYSTKERFELAMNLNNLLASPGFSAWMQGAPLEIGSLLYTSDGRPRISILSIAHLSDAERMFFVTILLNEVIAWMRMQAGTTSLRALLYMDEIYGYFPPTAVPPSKRPMLTLLKQARAFGLGVVLSTQNPVDLDYKGLSNAGTWFIGRLQTERDKNRVLDGLESVSSTAGVDFNRQEMEKIISSLGKRVFLMHNVHEDKPVLFHTRWALSYLRGPLTRSQIQTLMGPRKQALSAEMPEAALRSVSSVEEKLKEGLVAEVKRPILPPEIREYYLPLKSPLSSGESLVYRPSLHAAQRLHFVNTGVGVDTWQTEAILADFPEKEAMISWDEARSFREGEILLKKEGHPEARFLPLPKAASRVSNYNRWNKDLASYLYQYRTLKLRRSPMLKAVSRPGEGEGEFRARLTQLAREKRDLEVEKLRKRYAPKLARMEERLRGAQVRVEREKDQYGQQKVQTAISFGATVLGALFGRKLGSTGNVGRATTSMRGIGRAAREREDIARAKEEVMILRQKLVALEDEFKEVLAQKQEEFHPEDIELEELSLKPRKSDISVSVLSLVWAPWKVGAMGISEPGF